MDANALHLHDIQSYCDEVVSGKRPASKWEKYAVTRHLKNIERQNTEEFPYVFDLNKALAPIKFGECFPHVKGKWAKGTGKQNRVRLKGWQKFILAVLFGWVHCETGLRLYRIAYICVPRKNGKSVLAAIIGLFMLSQDGEYGAEVYCGAKNEKQAWEVFRPAKWMAEKQPTYRRKYGVVSHAKKLSCDLVGTKPMPDGRKRLPDGSRFEPVIGKPGDGASPSCAILDEVHEHDDDVLYDTMLTGMGAREQPMLLMVTTAGSNTSGPCFAIQKEVERVLQGTEVNEELFGIIYTVDDPEHEWRTAEGLVKANPNIDISIGRDFLLARVKDAENNPRKRSTVLTKHFNIWVTAKNAWLNMILWNKSADASLVLSDFKGERAGLGLDLSETDDLTAKVLCFRRVIDGLDHYCFFGKYYTTEEKQQENDHYDEWVLGGYLLVCDGATIDYEEVEQGILEDAEIFSIPQCFYDPHGAAHLAQNLARRQIEPVKVGQNYTNFTAPMREFERLLKAGRIHHDGNPCLTWMFGNVVAKELDDGKMMRPVKEGRQNKIDGAVAALLAFLAVYQPEDECDYSDFISDPIIV